jgi:hypothetical protein
MLSWRGAIDGARRSDTTVFGRWFTLRLLDDVRFVRRAFSKTAFAEKSMQVDQRRRAHARRADLHATAGNRIQHPSRQGYKFARRQFDMDDLTTRALLAILPTQPPPKQRVPAVVNFDLLRDMGRMNVRFVSAGKTGCLLVPTAAPKTPPPS